MILLSRNPGQAGERFLFVANGLDEAQLHNTIYLWEDLRHRAPDTAAYLVANDGNSLYENAGAQVTALNCPAVLAAHGIEYIAWSERERFIPKLAA